MRHALWLQTGQDRLVELDTGRCVVVRAAPGGELGVWLCGRGADVHLHSGPAAHTYLAGLALLLGAVTTESVLGFGSEAA